VIPTGTVVNDISAVLQAGNVRQYAGDNRSITRHALIAIVCSLQFKLLLVITHTRATNGHVVLQCAAAVVNSTGRHYRLV
jgi:hypothetical protein